MSLPPINNVINQANISKDEHGHQLAANGGMNEDGAALEEDSIHGHDANGKWVGSSAQLHTYNTDLLNYLCDLSANGATASTLSKVIEGAEKDTNGGISGEVSQNENMTGFTTWVVGATQSAISSSAPPPTGTNG
jgi:hypothetical protein